MIEAYTSFIEIRYSLERSLAELIDLKREEVNALKRNLLKREELDFAEKQLEHLRAIEIEYMERKQEARKERNLTAKDEYEILRNILYEEIDKHMRGMGYETYEYDFKTIQTLAKGYRIYGYENYQKANTAVLVLENARLGHINRAVNDYTQALFKELQEVL